MRKPPQHEIDEQGEALLQTIMARLHWSVTRIGKGADYGRDFEIEIFRDGRSTGILFNAQLKSSASPAYSKDNSFVSVKLETPSARYLAHELQVPALVMQADVVQNRLFWSTPQTDRDLHAKLAQTPPGKTCKVRVPLRNELPATGDELIETVTQLMVLLGSRRLAGIEPAALVAATSSMQESAALSRSLRNHSDTLDLMSAQRSTAAGDFETARKAIQTVLASAQSHQESKFFAVLLEEKNERLAIHNTDQFRGDHVALVHATAQRLRDLTRNGPGALKLYALIARVAAEFYKLAKDDWGLFENWKVHQSTGSLWWRAELRVLRAEAGRRLLRKYEQFIRLVRLSERTPYQPALPLAFLRIIEGAATLINRLELEGLPEAAASIRDSVFEVTKVAAAISAQYGQDSERVQAILSAGVLSRDRSAACVHWAETEVAKVPDEALRAEARAILVGQAASLTNGSESSEAIPIAMEQQIYENMAAGLGIDLADRNNPISEAVRVGIADFDPTRVLRDCRHLFVCLSGRGPGFLFYLVARQLQLQTMGAKVIHCTRHGYAREGQSLDETYERFRREYCDHCPDRSPRQPGWQYTHAWQLEENERNKELMTTPRSAPRVPVAPPPIPMPGEACAACGREFGGTGAPWWCGHCQRWFCQRQECVDRHEKHPWPF